MTAEAYRITSGSSLLLGCVTSQSSCPTTRKKVSLSKTWNWFGLLLLFSHKSTSAELTPCTFSPCYILLIHGLVHLFLYNLCVSLCVPGTKERAELTGDVSVLHFQRPQSCLYLSAAATWTDSLGSSHFHFNFPSISLWKYAAWWSREASE